MAMRLGAKRGGLLLGSLQSRAFSDGRVLDEEEKAAENMYIKKMEKEKLEKLKQQQATKAEEPAGGSSSSPDSSSIPGPSTDSSKNIAVFASIAGLLAVVVWYARSGTKKEEQKKT